MYHRVHFPPPESSAVRSALRELHALALDRAALKIKPSWEQTPCK